MSQFASGEAKKGGQFYPDWSRVRYTRLFTPAMPKQPHLPGIPDRPTMADVKALVAARLVGFELRQEERARRRAERSHPPVDRTAERQPQAHLFGHPVRDQEIPPQCHDHHD